MNRSAWPARNLWLGVSVEDQPTADERIPLLLECPAALHFVSYEPALGPVDFRAWTEPLCKRCEGRGWVPVEGGGQACGACFDAKQGNGGPLPSALDWVIVGGESGNGARPFRLKWASEVRKQCLDAGVACFIKQLGARPCISEKTWRSHTSQFPLLSPKSEDPSLKDAGLVQLKLNDTKGGDWSEWPPGLRVREFPKAHRELF